MNNSLIQLHQGGKWQPFFEEQVDQRPGYCYFQERSTRNRNAAAGCGYQHALQGQVYQPVSIWAPPEKFSGEWGVSLNIKRENGS